MADSLIIALITYTIETLQIIYQDYTSFTRLLAKDNSSTIHYRNLQKLVIVMFRVKTGKISELLKS